MNARLEILMPRKWLFYAGYVFRHPHKAAARVRFKIRKLINPEYPCWAAGVVDFLKANLTSDHIVGEYGSGQSSFWLARRAKVVYSVEHDPDWFEYLRATTRRKNLGNLHLLFSKSDPDSYVSALEQKIPSPLDFLIIDGQFREECARKALKMVKKGGFIILDDTDRKEYEPFLHLLGKRIARFKERIRATDIYVCE